MAAADTGPAATIVGIIIADRPTASRLTARHRGCQRPAVTEAGISEEPAVRVIARRAVSRDIALLAARRAVVSTVVAEAAVVSTAAAVAAIGVAAADTPGAVAAVAVGKRILIRP